MQGTVILLSIVLAVNGLLALVHALRALFFWNQLHSSAHLQMLPGLAGQLVRFQEQLKFGVTIVLAPFAFGISERLKKSSNASTAAEERKPLMLLAAMLLGLGILAFVVAGFLPTLMTPAR